MKTLKQLLKLSLGLSNSTPDESVGVGLDSNHPAGSWTSLLTLQMLLMLMMMVVIKVHEV